MGETWTDRQIMRARVNQALESGRGRRGGSIAAVFFDPLPFLPLSLLYAFLSILAGSDRTCRSDPGPSSKRWPEKMCACRCVHVCTGCPPYDELVQSRRSEGRPAKDGNAGWIGESRHLLSPFLTGSYLPFGVNKLRAGEVGSLGDPEAREEGPSRQDGAGKTRRREGRMMGGRRASQWQ